MTKEAGEKWEVAANGYGVSLLGDENVLKPIVVIVAQPCEYTKNYCALQMGKMYGMCVTYTSKTNFKSSTRYKSS